MAGARRKAPSYGLNAQNNALVDRVDEWTAILGRSTDRARASLARLYDEGKHGYGSRYVSAKRAVVDQIGHLTGALESAELYERTSGRRIDELPRHAPFGTAHDAIRALRREIDRARLVRRQMTRVYQGGPETILGEHDQRRRRRR